MFRELKFGEELQNIWTRLYAGNKYLYPYSSYEYVQICRKCFRWQTHRWFDKTRILYYKNELTGVEIIAPLTWHKGKIYIYGDWESARLLDFVYSENVTNYDFEQLFYCLRDVGGVKKLNLNRLHDDSLLRRYIEEQKTFNWREDNNRVCVKIDFEEGYENYSSRLSKSARRNLRTAHNGLQKIGLDISLDFVDSFSDKKIIYDEVFNVYCDRQNSKYGKSYRSIRRLKLRYLDPLTIASVELHSGILAIVYIGDEIAGILTGFVTNRDSIFVPRLAIVDKFRKYKPGKLLIDFTVKYLCEKNIVRCLDLSNGDEPYKLEMGGTQYMSHGYEVELV